LPHSRFMWRTTNKNIFTLRNGIRTRELAKWGLGLCRYQQSAYVLRNDCSQICSDFILFRKSIGYSDLFALMMEAASTYETSVNFYQTTRRNIPEDSHLHTRLRENLKSLFLYIGEEGVYVAVLLRHAGAVNHVASLRQPKSSIDRSQQNRPASVPPWSSARQNNKLGATSCT
jgi:hypothetical protein